MDFEEWWDKKASDINRALKNNNDYIKPFFENAYMRGKVVGEKEERKRIESQHLTISMHSDSKGRGLKTMGDILREAVNIDK